MTMTVTLGGRSFVAQGGGNIPFSGVRTLRSIRGWFEQAPSAADVAEHWSVDGQFVTDNRRGARTIEMQGLLMARTEARIQEMRAEVARLKRNTLVVDEVESGLSREATVRMVDQRFETVAPLVVEYQLTLVADDPTRYSTATRSLSNGTVNIANDGDETAYPVLELSGSHGSITIDHPGGTFVCVGPSSGQTMVLDFRNGDLWNGNTRLLAGTTTIGPLPRVAVGGSSWTVSGLGSGSATLSRYEAWS